MKKRLIFGDILLLLGAAAALLCTPQSKSTNAQSTTIQATKVQSLENLVKDFNPGEDAAAYAQGPDSTTVG